MRNLIISIFFFTHCYYCAQELLDYNDLNTVKDERVVFDINKIHSTINNSKVEKGIKIIPLIYLNDSNAYFEKSNFVNTGIQINLTFEKQKQDSIFAYSIIKFDYYWHDIRANLQNLSLSNLIFNSPIWDKKNKNLNEIHSEIFAYSSTKSSFTYVVIRNFSTKKEEFIWVFHRYRFMFAIKNVF